MKGERDGNKWEIEALRHTAPCQSRAREFRGVLSLHINDPLDVLCRV